MDREAGNVEIDLKGIEEFLITLNPILGLLATLALVSALTMVFYLGLNRIGFFTGLTALMFLALMIGSQSILAAKVKDAVTESAQAPASLAVRDAIVSRHTAAMGKPWSEIVDEIWVGYSDGAYRWRKLELPTDFKVTYDKAGKSEKAAMVKEVLADRDPTFRPGPKEKNPAGTALLVPLGYVLATIPLVFVALLRRSRLRFRVVIGLLVVITASSTALAGWLDGQATDASQAIYEQAHPAYPKSVTNAIHSARYLELTLLQEGALTWEDDKFAFYSYEDMGWSRTG